MQDSLNHNFHIPLTDDLYRALRLEAERRKRPATALAREVLAQWLERLRAQALHGEIADYAAIHAGTSADLDAELEAAGIEAIAGKTSTKRPRIRKSKDR